MHASATPYRNGVLTRLYRTELLSGTDVVRWLCGHAIVTVVQAADFRCDDNAPSRQG
jgi:hypothetical protein